VQRRFSSGVTAVETPFQSPGKWHRSSSAAGRGPACRCVSTQRPFLTATLELVALTESRFYPNACFCGESTLAAELEANVALFSFEGDLRFARVHKSPGVVPKFGRCSSTDSVGRRHRHRRVRRRAARRKVCSGTKIAAGKRPVRAARRRRGPRLGHRRKRRGESRPQYRGTGPTADNPEPDVAGNPGTGKVVRPVGLTVPDAGPDVQNWTSAQGLVIDGCRYDFIVDRSTQSWGPADFNQGGYMGRWGPRVETDPFGRRAGTRFPAFWRLFFLAARAEPRPGRLITEIARNESRALCADPELSRCLAYAPR
jgi:hypothetical protein